MLCGVSEILYQKQVSTHPMSFSYRNLLLEKLKFCSIKVNYVYNTFLLCLLNDINKDTILN